MQAEVATFNVNIVGAPSPGDSTPHEMRVFGTITLDPDLPLGTAVTSTNLHFQHLDDLPKPLVTPFQSTSSPSPTLEWNVIGDELFINRISSDYGVLGWETRGVVERVLISLRSGPPGIGSHILLYDGFRDVDVAVLKPASEPDGSMGFLFGTRVVPEPTMASFLMSIVAMTCLHRPRRSQ